MQYIEYNNLVDRTCDFSGQWPSGPWDSEPDKIQYQDEDTGLPCLIKRNSCGILCGYVGVPKEHPSYGKHYDEVDVEVHGGLTFSDKCSGDETGICHIVDHGENDDVWWLGFDCGHAGDLTPAFLYMIKKYPETVHYTKEKYRDIKYVKKQNANLAKQLKTMSQRRMWIRQRIFLVIHKIKGGITWLIKRHQSWEYRQQIRQRLFLKNLPLLANRSQSLSLHFL